MAEAGVEAEVPRIESNVSQVDDACPGGMKMSAERKILA